MEPLPRHCEPPATMLYRRPHRADEENQTNRNSNGASKAGRVLVTFNVAHFAQLHGAWLREGKHHAGIVASSQRPVRDVLRRLLHLAASRDAETTRDRIEFLSDW
jgi:hypothetical protein